MHQVAVDIVPILLTCVLEINIFGKDYWNNLFQRFYFSSIYIHKFFCREQRHHLMQQKKDSIGITFFKNILPKFFVNFSCKRVLWPLGHIFNKVNGGIVQRFDEVGTKNCPGR